jgi:hypothetical protein
MKKIIGTFVVLSLLFASCSQELEMNNEPGFLSKKNDEIWKAEGITVKKIGGALVIEVANGLDKIFLNTSSTNVGTYHFGTSNPSNLGVFTQNIDATMVTYATTVVEGPVKSINAITSAGDFYVAGIANTTSNTGIGQGLRVKTTVTAGKVTKVDLVAPGLSYKSGDIVTILGGNGEATVQIKDVISSNGFVKITENKAGIIKGEFQFTAKRNVAHPFADETVTFSEGNFYNLNTN